MARFSILVASDLSERSDRALGRAFKLAESLDADLTLCSVVDDSLPENLTNDLMKRSKEFLKAKVDELGKGSAPEIVVEKGDPVTLLIEMISGSSFDLVVFGRHRSRRMFDGIRKTTVESIASHARKPLLLVVNSPLHEYRRILAPTAFSPACLRAVDTAKSIAPNAQLNLIHAWYAPFEGLAGGKHCDYAKTVAKEVAEQAKEWSAKLKSGKFTVDLVYGGLGTTVFETINSFQPDLLAVGAHTRSISISGLGSFTSELLRDPPTDLLVTM